jgi:hypothetical protein
LQTRPRNGGKAKLSKRPILFVAGLFVVHDGAILINRGPSDEQLSEEKVARKKLACGTLFALAFVDVFPLPRRRARERRSTALGGDVRLDQ